jgi:hypothetical protein
MVGALIVLLAVIGAVMGLQALNRPKTPDPAPAVDYTQAARYARGQARFDLLAPPSLPAGWKATTVRFLDGPRQQWHLGMLTGDGRYVGLEQAERPVSDMLEAYVDPQTSRGGPVSVDGRQWRTYTDARGDLALVTRTGKATTLVVGHDVERARLLAFVGSLR